MQYWYLGATVKGVFSKLEDLVILDVEPTCEGEPDEWGNAILDRMRRKARSQNARYLNAPDLEGTYDGDSNGISVLIEWIHREDWQEAIEACGAVVTGVHPAHTGHYNDGHWYGVAIVKAIIEYDGGGADVRYLWLER